MKRIAPGAKGVAWLVVSALAGGTGCGGSAPDETEESGQAADKVEQAASSGCSWEFPPGYAQFLPGQDTCPFEKGWQIWDAVAQIGQPCACGSTMRTYYQQTYPSGLPQHCWYWDMQCACPTSDLVGMVESVHNGIATGYACDRDAPTAPIEVEIYVGGPKVEGRWPPVYHTRTTANLRREHVPPPPLPPGTVRGGPGWDPDLACAGDTPHWFRARINDEVLQNGVPIHVYAINRSGVGCGADAELDGSPRLMQCADARPIGWLDSVSGGVARGWACDRDDPAASISVTLLVGGPTKPRGDTSVEMYTVRADRPSEPAVGAICGGGTAHRFEKVMPTARPGVPVYAKAHNIVCGGGDSDLGGSPRTDWTGVPEG